MKIIDKGHKYAAQDNNSLNHSNEIRFFKDPLLHEGSSQEGTTNQELVRILIDRVQYLEEEKHSKYNEEIIFHLRSVIALHEKRHLDRLLEKSEPIEDLTFYKNGHTVELKENSETDKE